MEVTIDLDRLEKQIRFVVEADKLKSVMRQTLLTDESRREDSAQHSWHLALMAFLLADYAQAQQLDLLKVIKMALVHDLVEIDAGDTYCYDTEGQAGKLQRERLAAERIFGILPPDQAEEMHALWEEFEARATAEARFVAALDRLQPLLNNYETRGKIWQANGVKKHQVLDRNRHMAEGAPELWRYAAQLIQHSVDAGYLEV